MTITEQPFIQQIIMKFSQMKLLTAILGSGIIRSINLTGGAILTI